MQAAAVSAQHVEAESRDFYRLAPLWHTPEGMRKLMVEEIAKWNALIDKTKIQRL